MTPDTVAAQAVDQAFWQNIGVALAGAVAVIGAVLMGVKRYFRQWKDETASSNASSAGVVATEAMNLVVEMLRRELQQMADLYREVNEQRVELLRKVDELQRQIGKLEREISELRRVDEENSRLAFENAELETKLKTFEDLIASCVQCSVRPAGAHTRAGDAPAADSTLYGPGGRPAAGAVTSADDS